MNKVLIALIIIGFIIFILFGINAITYNSNSISFQFNNIFINSNSIVIGIFLIVFILMIYIGYRIVIKWKQYMFCLLLYCS